jgi:hypothetical protein
MSCRHEFHLLAVCSLSDCDGLKLPTGVASAPAGQSQGFHPADSSSEFRAEQTGVGGFVRESSHCCELLVNTDDYGRASFVARSMSSMSESSVSRSNTILLPSGVISKVRITAELLN